MDTDTREQFRLVWEQGIDVMRGEIKRLEVKIDESIKQVAAGRRAAFGQFIAVLTLFTTLIGVLLTRGR